MRRPTTTTLALSAVGALALTSCSSDSDLGDSEALSGVEFELNEEDGTPEVSISEEIETDEDAMRVLEQGDGENVDAGNILEYRMAAVDAETGAVEFENYSAPLAQMMWMPALAEAEDPADQFVYEAFTSEEATLGTELAIFLAGDEEAEQPTADQLFVATLEDQYPAYATGDPQDQEGDLPEITNEVGEAPELTDHDTETEAPDELVAETLSAGEGEEILEDDYVFAQYRGWRWEDGEEFDSSWDEDGAAGAPFDFSMTGGVIEGWTEGLQGQHEGDRVLLVVPAEQAYGETDNDDDGTTEEGAPGGALIFVVDIVRSIDAETMASVQQPQEPAESEISEEELQELMEQLQEQEDGEAPADSDDDDSTAEDEEE